MISQVMISKVGSIFKASEGDKSLPLAGETHCGKYAQASQAAKSESVGKSRQGKAKV